jgi:hypothetical protein
MATTTSTWSRLVLLKCFCADDCRLHVGSSLIHSSHVFYGVMQTGREGAFFPFQCLPYDSVHMISYVEI